MRIIQLPLCPLGVVEREEGQRGGRRIEEEEEEKKKGEKNARSGLGPKRQP